MVFQPIHERAPKVLNESMRSKQRVGYKAAGVNIDEADRAVSSIRTMARRTFTDSVLTDIGSFGGGYFLKGWRKPVLVSSADGVGTKLKLAFLTGRHDTVGEDLVNHCVNDIAVQGAVPLFFLDYFAVGKLNATVAAQVVSGIARGCKANGCALIGGETAEMPGMYTDGEYDLAGFIVGAVERKRMITGQTIRKGDLVIGLPSIADELLKLHRSYLKPLSALHNAGLLKGAAHITGGGITDNTPRILPKGLGVVVDRSSWPVLPVFELLRTIGDIPEDDYRRTFNLGIGMIFVVGRRNVTEAAAILRRGKERFYEIGEVVEVSGSGPRVVYR